MLVKVGESYVDPMQVVAVHPGWMDEDGVMEMETEDGRPIITLDLLGDDRISVTGITCDEAAQIINRCREAEMGKR